MHAAGVDTTMLNMKNMLIEDNISQCNDLEVLLT